MSADPIIYCLERLTDYRQFERLCSDVMAGVGYVGIEPLGGSGDRGRDALYVSRDTPNAVTLFAYSVRSDWKRKLLLEDCKRIQNEDHDLQRLVFVSSSTITASENDAAKHDVRKQFGWELELYDLERLRILLAGELRHLVAQHPSIFCSPWFPTKGGLSISEAHDTIVIDHVERDHAFATWLSRKLQSAGYRTWCYGTAPMAGEDADGTLRTLIKARASLYLPVLSPIAVADGNFVSRCGLASDQDGFVVPCVVTEHEAGTLGSRMQSLTPVSFAESWSSGIGTLLKVFAARGVKPVLDADRGMRIALRSYVPQSVVQPKVETVYANVFHVEVPPGVVTCQLAQQMPQSALSALRQRWAFVVASPTRLLAFDVPPEDVSLTDTPHLPETAWDSVYGIEGIRSRDLVKELVRRSLEVACYGAGLVWCEDRRTFYFSHKGSNPQRNVSYQHVDGRNTWVGVTGEKTYGAGERATPFRFQLGPKFRVGQDEAGEWWVTAQIYVRITDRGGRPYEKKAIGRRRKRVTRGWWNKEWFARTLAIMQALSHGKSRIEIGGTGRMVTVDTVPLSWDCPVAIDYHAVERAGDFQEELAALRFDDGERVDEEGVDERGNDE